MRLRFAYLLFTSLLFCTLSAQQNTSFSKEATISGGFGFSNAISNATGKVNTFLQLDYLLLPGFSIATDFEFLQYNRPSYYTNATAGLDLQYLFDNNFSLLIKYHLPIASKLKIAVGTGWTFSVRQNVYYDYHNDVNGQGVTLTTSTYSGYVVPFVADAKYPVWKDLSAMVRIKYNMDIREGSTYSVSAGASIKL